jgi:hypothetical protein
LFGLPCCYAVTQKYSLGTERKFNEVMLNAKDALDSLSSLALVRDVRVAYTVEIVRTSGWSFDYGGATGAAGVCAAGLSE